MEQKTCTICQITKDIIEFPKAGKYNGKSTYRGECKLCNQEKQRTNPAHKEAQKKYKSSECGKANRRLYRKKPEVRAKEQAAENRRYAAGPKKKQIINRINKKLKDPAFYGIWLLKNALRDWVKTNGERKNSKIGNYVGCTKEKFRIHIESQFTPEMNWNNHAEYWEYDHIKPISSANSMEKAYKLTHYTNIQPLEKPLNRIKSNKISKEYNNI